MLGLTGLKLAGAIGGMAAVLAAGAAAAWLVTDHHKLAQADKDHRACVAAVKAAPGKGQAGLTFCDPAIASAAAARDQSRACDEALSVAPENLFAARSSCSAGVKVVIATRDAVQAELTGANTELNTLRADQADAVRRAEARGQAQAQSESHAKARIAALPPGGDGLRTCDAECLRHLTDPAG